MSHVQLLLPRNLASLAKCCEKAGIVGRFAMTGVNLERTSEGYVATATDGRTMVRVEGPSDAPDEYPMNLDAAPNGATSAIIGAKDWTSAFKGIPKRGKPILQRLAVCMSKDVTTLATTDADKESVSAARNIDGRFPEIGRVIPKGDTLAATINVNAELLARVLEIATEYTTGDSNSVTIELHKAGYPIKLHTSNEEGQRFTALVVPLTTVQQGTAELPEVPDAGNADQIRSIQEHFAAKLDALYNTVATLTQERDGLQAELTEYKVAEPAKRIAELTKERDELQAELDVHTGALEAASYLCIGDMAMAISEAEDRADDAQNASNIDANRLSEAWKRITNLETVNGLLRRNFDEVLNKLK